MSDSQINSTTVQEVQETVRRAIDDKTPLEAVGGGTQIHIGHSSSEKYRRVASANLTRIVDYVPEDLVIVAEAGLTISAVQSVLAEQGQTIPLEVALPDQQTLGGIVASRANSLCRGANGSVRDWLIGCHVVGGEGQLIVAGGKVVKNVAGYDLPKLYCGSWGTLGIITQVAFKVAPIQPASSIILVTLTPERNPEEGLDDLHRRMTPTFSYLLNPTAARMVLGDGAPAAQFVAVGYDGQPEAVDDLCARAEAILQPYAFQVMRLPVQVATKFRSALRDLPANEAPLAVKFNVLPSQVGAFARMLEWTADRGGLESAAIFADTGIGTLWAQFYPPNDPDVDSLGWSGWSKFYLLFKDKAERVGGSFVIERMPEVWQRAGVPVWSPVLPEVEWMRKIKHSFDPHHIFRPGSYVGRM